jgi:predicted permease
MLNRLQMWSRWLFQRSRSEREMREEMELHLQRATDRLMARGLTRAEAEVEARREFGSVERLRQEGRDARGGQWIDALRQDLRFAVRQFARKPLSASTIVLVLSLGIGGNVALFTFLHSLATQPPPGVPRNESLVRIRRIETWPGPGARFVVPLSYPEVQAYALQAGHFRGVAAWDWSTVVLDSADAGRGVVDGAAVYVTDDYFRVLGVRPLLGPGLPSAAVSAAATSLVGVISHVLWDERFGRSPDVLGTTVAVNGIPIAVVGVAPARFDGVDGSGPPRKVWLPLAARAVVERSGSGALASYDSTSMSVVARLQPGVTMAEAEAAVRTVTARAAEARTRTYERAETADVVPLRAGNARQNAEDGAAWAGMGVAALLVLLITCTTASTLLVGLAVARRREIAVRLSLGAARSRLVRQLVTESTLLALAAGGLGLLLAFILIRTIAARVPELPLVLAWPAVVFMLGVAVATGLLFGLSPALHATRLAVGEVLKDAASAVSASRSWLQRGLVVTQIALTQPLLVGLAALLVVAAAELLGRPSTPVLDRIVAIEFNTFAGSPSIEQQKAVMSDLRARFAGMPGVVGAVAAADGRYTSTVALHPADRVAGSPASSFSIDLSATAAGHFALHDVPVVRGREFTADDEVPTSNALIIGTDLARSFWGSADPIGRRLVHANGPVADSTSLVVVGVVDEVRAGSSDTGGRPRAYMPNRYGALQRSILIRTAGPAAAMIPALRDVAGAVAPQVPIVRLTTLAAQERENRRSLLQLSGAAAAGGLLALLLSAIGLYAVIAFAVGQQTREIGIRTALGADRRRVVGRYFTGGMRLTALGLVLGLPLSLVALRVISVQMGAQRASTPVVASLIALVVLLIASLATWLPARRAAGVDPLIALRSD